MKITIVTLIGCFAFFSSPVFAQSELPPLLHCGPLSISVFADHAYGSIGEVKVSCRDVSQQSGWGDVAFTCQGGQPARALPDGTCTPSYSITVNHVGTVEIGQDIASCHACAVFEPIFAGNCK